MKLRELVKGKITKNELDKLKASYDLVGSIAIIDIPPELAKKEKIIAEAVMKQHKNVKTVAKKVGIHGGEFRLQKVKIISGERAKETQCIEHKVRLMLNVEKVYFSVRLSTERKRISDLVKKGERVLVMFSGCAPYPCVFAKNSLAKEIIGVEKNKIAHEYGEKNLKLNKIKNVKLYCGDVKKIVPGLGKFDRIVMPLPKDASSFLDIALKAAKKGSTVHFYDFLHEEDIPKSSVEKIAKACKDAGRKCRILRTVKVGQYAPRKYRVCVDFMVS